VLDYAITGATIVDGSGAPAFRGDLGIKDGLIVELGELGDTASRTFSADGLIVTPGFVDPHTHYDAQLFWDPSASPSNWHGVTTVIAGNCGFTLAPLKAQDADYTRKMMAQVEGMPLSALERGVPWEWEGFGEYLGSLEGRVGVNTGFMVGHCALRRYVLGDDFGRDTTPAERDQMRRLLDDSLVAGGLGLSTTRSATHIDAERQPVPSRWASEEELLDLCEVVGRHDGMSIEFISDGCLNRFSDADVELMARMSVAGRAPLNWNALSVSAGERDKMEAQLRPSIRARQLGGRVVALTMPVLADMNVSFLTYCALWLIPGWADLFTLDVAERIQRLQDPAVRVQLVKDAVSTRWARFADFARYVIGDVFSEGNERYRGRLVGEIASERGQDAFATLVDIVAADDLRTVLWPPSIGNGEADWRLRSELWAYPDVLLGGSDAGAHLDRMLGSSYPTRFISDVLRGHRLLSIERAVQLITDAPARLFGLRGRGRLQVGWRADIAVLDPEQVGSTLARTSFDLPGDNKRLVADSTGVVRVLINGREAMVDGCPTGELLGTVLRSSRDTSSASR
jgi:N-acyl-D-aspartate/D-glutamate deacylase